VFVLLLRENEKLWGTYWRWDCLMKIETQSPYFIYLG
jgi:hypothetical protein